MLYYILANCIYQYGTYMTPEWNFQNHNKTEVFAFNLQTLFLISLPPPESFSLLQRHSKIVEPKKLYDHLNTG